MRFFIAGVIVFYGPVVANYEFSNAARWWTAPQNRLMTVVGCVLSGNVDLNGMWRTGFNIAVTPLYFSDRYAEVFDPNSGLQSQSV